jgi:ArsR family transcriptional regulator
MATKIALDISQCAPAPGIEPMARDKATDIASLLKAVADPTRLQILALIRQGENSQACTCDLTGPLNLSQPTISHHMKKLTEVGLLEAERKGTWVYYRINKAVWNQIAQLFD